ncbi:MAG: glycosyltransferase family 87 protein [Acidimicrobiales bacterium]
MSSAVASDPRVAPKAQPNRPALDKLRASSWFEPLAFLVTAALWVAAAVTWSQLCYRIGRPHATLGWDLVTSWHAVVVFAHGGQPYDLAQTDNRLFLYPPSSLLLMRPIAALTLRQIQVVGLVVTAVAAWCAVMVSAHIAGRRWYGPTAALCVLALHYARPMVAELSLQNATILCLLALAGFWWLASRQHWMWAGVLVGLSMSLKPLLIVLLLIFLVERKWKPLAVAIAIPAALNAAAFVFVSDPAAVFRKLPSLVNRSGSGVLSNSAWVDVLRDFNLSSGSIDVIRLVTAAVALAAAWLAWRLIEDSALRLITVASSLLLGSYLAGTLSEDHYMLTMIPLLISLVLPGSPMRWFPAWVGFALMMGLEPPRAWLGLGTVANQSAWMAFGMMLVLLTITAALASRHKLAAAR